MGGGGSTFVVRLTCYMKWIMFFDVPSAKSNVILKSVLQFSVRQRERLS